MIVNNHFSCQLCRISHDYMVTQHTIMRDMAVSHNQAIVPDNGFTPGNGSPVDGHEFPYGCIVADNGKCLFSSEFQVLGNGAYHCPGKDTTVFTDSCTFHDPHVGTDTGSLSDDNIFINNGKRLYLDR